MKVAVLLTTYNRRQKTLDCLERLAGQQLPKGVDLEIFLTDDNSADGTAAAVHTLFPAVRLFKGTGSLFWAGGMRYTWKQALLQKPDYYLLLNDDTLLHQDAIASLLQLAGEPETAICIGSTCDNQSGKLSYGGWKLLSKWRWQSKTSFSTSQVTECDFANANIMLVPKEVVNTTGILADHFIHSLADYDYCLRARNQGYKIKVAPGFLGTCTDDHGPNWKSSKTTLKERIRYLKSPKGLAYKEYLSFIGRHFPLSLPSAFVKLWMKTFFPIVWDRFKKQG